MTVYALNIQAFDYLNYISNSGKVLMIMLNMSTHLMCCDASASAISIKTMYFYFSSLKYAYLSFSHKSCHKTDFHETNVLFIWLFVCFKKKEHQKFVVFVSPSLSSIKLSFNFSFSYFLSELASNCLMNEKSKWTANKTKRDKKRVPKCLACSPHFVCECRIRNSVWYYLTSSCQMSFDSWK